MHKLTNLTDSALTLNRACESGQIRIPVGESLDVEDLSKEFLADDNIKSLSKILKLENLDPEAIKKLEEEAEKVKLAEEEAARVLVEEEKAAKEAEVKAEQEAEAIAAKEADVEADVEADK